MLVYVSEYPSGLFDPPLVEQVIPVTPDSIQSAPFGSRTKILRVHAAASCSILIGRDPKATINNGRMSRNETEIRGVSPGDRIAVIANE